MKGNRYTVYRIGPTYFFWNGKLIMGLCKKIFKGGYDVTFGLINTSILKAKIDYESDISDSKNLSKTMNTFKYIYGDVLAKKGIICMSAYSFVKERYKYESQCFTSAVSNIDDLRIMDKEIHKFPFTTIAYNPSQEIDVKQGLSKQGWFNGPKENEKKFETPGGNSSLND